jgi:hypothetical protein
LLSPDFFYKKIKGDLISHKPILIVKSKEALTALENEVLKKSRPVYISDEISLYELDISELFRSSAPAVVDSFSRQKPRLAVRGTLLVSSGSSFVYHDGFDTSLSQRPLRGKGGFQSTKKGKNIMARFAPGTFKPGITYRASVWMFNGHENAINNWFRFIIEERDGQDNEVTTTVCFPDNSEVIDGNWSMADVAFQVSNPSNHITLYVKGKKDETNSFFADELLVREENINVYQLDSPSRSLYVNNLPVPLR